MQTKIALLIFLLAVLFGANAQENWTLFPSFPGGAKTSLATLEDSIFFAGSLNGIYRSGNAGKSFKRTLSTTAVHSLIATVSGKVIAGGSGKIYFSTDKGISWDSATVPTRFPIKEIAATSNGLFCITGVLDESLGYIGDGIFFNSGDLKAWINKSAGLFSNGYCEHITTDRYGRLYVTMGDEYVTGGGGLFISDNNGDSWTKSRLFVDGLGDIKTLNTFTVSVTPSDSVVLSVAGTVVNFSVSLNIIKHRKDVTSEKSWGLLRVRTTSSWWLDLPLNSIHFASNGQWYASVTNSALQGGVFVSEPGGRKWTRYVTGLGLAPTQQFEPFTFVEDSYGRIVASQFLDERIYLTTRSMINAVVISGRIIDDQGDPLNVTIDNTFSPLSTDLNGVFKLKVPVGWSGELKPKRNQYDFAPESISIKSIQKDIGNQNFAATYTGTHSLWGFVKDVFGLPISDVIISGFAEQVRTNEYGAFSVAVQHGWKGEVTLSREGLEIAPSQMKIDPVYKDFYAYQFTAKEKGKLVVSGTIKDESGRPINSALIEGFPEDTRVNEEGKFVALVAEGWQGEIKVSHPDFTFYPASIQIQIVTADLINQNFIGSRVSYRISGTIKNSKATGLVGVKLNGLPKDIVTDDSGNFSLFLPSSWSGTITPILDDHIFVPASITIPSLNQHLDLTFSAVYSGNYVLSGHVKSVDGLPLSGIPMHGFSENVQTDEFGFFSSPVPAGWTGTITPRSPDFTFTPASFVIENLEEHRNALNFTGSVITSLLERTFKTQVFPNPSNDGVIHIQFSEQLQNAVTVTVLSASGQEIDYLCSEGNAVKKVELPGKGLFFIKLVHEDGISTHKVIVN